MFWNQRPDRRKSSFDQLAGIASIVSAAILCIRLAWMGLLSVDWAAGIMVGVVILVAIGNVATKLGISAVAIYLFSKWVSGGDQQQFQMVLTTILAILIMLIGLYIMLRGVFGKNR